MEDLRIYVASLSDYNNGRLHGAWIDCDGLDKFDLQEVVGDMLRGSHCPNVTVSHPETGEDVPSAEEYAIHDHEGFGDLIGEYTPLSEVAEIVELLEGADEPEALKEFADNYGYSLKDAADNFESAYCGQCDSERDYAYDYLESTGELDADSWAARYFDYDAFTRDLFMDHTRTESGHVFNDNH